MTQSWTEVLKQVTPGKVLKWSGVAFLTCLELMILAAIAVWLGDHWQ